MDRSVPVRVRFLRDWQMVLRRSLMLLHTEQVLRADSSWVRAIVQQSPSQSWALAVRRLERTDVASLTKLCLIGIHRALVQLSVSNSLLQDVLVRLQLVWLRVVFPKRRNTVFEQARLPHLKVCHHPHDRSRFASHCLNGCDLASREGSCASQFFHRVDGFEFRRARLLDISM